jgi:hypothetical protein
MSKYQFFRKYFRYRISRGSTDFSGLGAIFTKPFTNTAFAGNVFCLLTIWVPPIVAVMVWENPCYNRNPKWFFIFQDLFDARSRYQKPM